MIVNSADIRIYSEPPPVGTPPVKHDRKWRQTFTTEYSGLPYGTLTSPKHFEVKSLKTTAWKNSRYNTKRQIIIPLRPTL